MNKERFSGVVFMVREASMHYRHRTGADVLRDDDLLV